VMAHRFAVASANPMATQAGFEMLKAGGSAMDAAIAAQLVLGLVEPQSSGVGGGALILYSDGQRLTALDGRETAPGAATEDLFLDPQGQPLAFYDAVVGGRSVGTPGTLRVLALAHERYGKLPWKKLFQSAIRWAREGFAISPRLHAQIQADAYLRQDPQALAYFYDAQGQAHPVGFKLRNLAYADLLTRVAKQGVDAFYRGTVAQEIVDKVQQHPSNPGRLQLSDLSHYQAKVREVLCFDEPTAQRLLRVCGFPAPSSGLIAMGQIFGILRQLPHDHDHLVNGWPDAVWLHRYTEASRLAFADRAQYVADPDFVAAPAGDWASLLAPSYLQQRAQWVGERRMPLAPAGKPTGATDLGWAAMGQQPEHGTSHISVVDAQGNAVAMTTTVESAFGSRQMVHGFLLNNELTDFSFVPRDAQGRPVANRVEPFKRPRSSMSPTLVMDGRTGALQMTLGSPGGAMIIAFTTKTLFGLSHWGLTPQQAIDLPNVVSTADALWVEPNGFDETTLQTLRQLGHEVKEQDLPSGIQAIVRTQVNHQSVWMGGADSRREGLVLGR
jgi:gamma-glutamyltranspeptidase / glutathione hydrolase